MNLKERIAALGMLELASINAQPVSLELDYNYIVTPNPSVDELENNGLGDEFDLETQYEEAVEAFENSDDYGSWVENHRQRMLNVWPVNLFQNTHQEVAQILEDLGVAVVIAEVPEDREREFEDYNALIVMTGSGTDLSNDIAQGYLACGQVPPTVLLECMCTALMDRFHNEDMKVLMGEAFRRAADYHRSRMERFEEVADKHFPEEGVAPRF
ncbi:hypothetical protein [Roseibium sp. RKSG952]|uniref:hypothetical protein n=1 Tax=Roseibium sp. RKSG952 TaxID=2529384 RepID=UPI0012BD2F4D|nr:hypothetical protein [Roseibium sp. RKSG952]MTH95468.1 hypothetical protein [Roseibium sp. RKSG952]